MIVRLTQGMCELALRIRQYGTGNLAVPCGMRLQLGIWPGQLDQPCGPNGSPWFLHGCWPGKLTDVDIANPQPYDFAPIMYEQDRTDNEGRAVFKLDHRLWRLPCGRYTGVLQMLPGEPEILDIQRIHVMKKKPDRGIPPEYLVGQHCGFEPPKHKPLPSPPEACILSMFDIDLGPCCSDHMVDQVNVEFPLSCEGEI